ncbi:MAG TPA: hypothetical protein VNC11_13765 [Gemmatimonadaceae bacterium]|jgi:hypothetical protein|nr:hypothetical protein [Gemmatimonadaceae bacterium]
MQTPQDVVSILEIVIPGALGIVFIIAAGVVSVTWIQKRSTKQTIDSGAEKRISERLDHLTNAVDAIAVEVERISEGQRFTTKLLSDTASTPDTYHIK